jgi:hypothetical protein
MLARMLVVGVVHMVTYWVGIDDDLLLRRHDCFAQRCKFLDDVDVSSSDSGDGSRRSRYVIVICVLAEVVDALCQNV